MNKKTQINHQQIKDALIEVADFFGRPHYEVSVVRDVITSFRTGVSHPLKHLVVRELSLLASSTVVKKQDLPTPKVKQKLNADILGHGTSTKYLLGCRCEECIEWA